MKANSIIPVFKFENSELPFEIRTVREVREDFGDRNASSHSHDYFEMIWIICGKGIFYIDLQQNTIDGNQIFCVKPGQVHRLHLDDHAEGFVFSFTDSFMNIGEHEFDWSCQSVLFQLFSGCKGIAIRSDIESEIMEVALKMMKECDHQYSFRMQILKRYFKILLIYISRQIDDSREPAAYSRNKELVQSFLHLLEKSFKQKKMVAEYAWQLSVTPNYLNEIVKKSTGYSAGHHIRQRVVLEAKRMGAHSGVCMKEVAYDLGFSDSAHFSKFFKTVAGENFSDFKRENGRVALIA